MNTIKIIRARLGMTQQELAAVLGMSQGNVAFYERGQVVPPAVAGRLISYACAHGCAIGYEDIYGVPAPYEIEKNRPQAPASIALTATDSVAQGVA